MPALRTKFVVGNWKLNGSLETNAALLSALVRGVKEKPGRHCVVCAPYPYLASVQVTLRGAALAWGAQDVSQFEKGAYTGEVSAQMVAEFGASFAIVGHSERRAIFGESDEVVAKKFGHVLAAGLTPILCVGETLAERELGNTEEVVARQLDAVIARHGIQVLAGAVLAYEPVWAIGTGKTALPDQAQRVHAFLRGRIAQRNVGIAETLPILYGGSVKNSNASEIFSQADIDGGLIGGASLIADDFLGIWHAL